MIDVKPIKTRKPITNNRIIRVCFVLTIALSTVFTSGCSSQGNGILGQQSILDSDENPDIKNAPFAYDIAADTISYNSCVMMPNVTSTTIHGLKIGSSEGFVDTLGTGAVKGGLKLRTDFLQYVGQKFTPDYPSNSITPAQIMRILGTSYSTQNANAKLQFAVRKKSNYSVVPDQIDPVAAPAALVGRDAIVFEQNLSSGFLGYSITKGISFSPAGLIIQEGPRTYNLSEATEAIPIEATFAFNASADASSNGPGGSVPLEAFGFAELYTQQVRDSFNTNTQILTATFGGTQNTTGVPADDAAADTVNNIKRPYASNGSTFDQSKAFGRGYNLKFESQTSVTTWPKNRLTQVNEINLDTGTPTGGTSWSCEQFAIAPLAHWNNNKPKNAAWVKDSLNVEPNCAPLLASDTICSGSDNTTQCNIKKDRAEKIKRIRRQYSVDNWNIGLLFPTALRAGYTPPDRRILEMCVSPKGDVSCYLPTVGIVSTDPNAEVGIQYDRTKSCYLTGATFPDVTSRDLARKNGRCAQYASVCVRTSSNY